MTRAVQLGRTYPAWLKEHPMQALCDPVVDPRNNFTQEQEWELGISGPLADVPEDTLRALVFLFARRFYPMDPELAIASTLAEIERK